MPYRFAVIGLGRFGASVATTLANKGAEVLAVDIDEERVENLRDDVAHALTMDSRDIRTLKAQNIEDLDGVVVAIGRNFEAMLLTTVHLMDLDVKRIIARAMNSTQRMILEKMGIKEIISPEVEVGVSVAQQLLNPSMLNFLQLPDDHEIVEIACPPNVEGRSVSDIDLRKRYDLNLITIKRPDDQGIDHIVGVPGPETRIEQGDTLILMGKDADIKRFVDVNR
jgi:trk system potassium uptake protein TrkA